MSKELLANMDKIHTTEMGVVRIKRNLGLNGEDAVNFCKQLIQTASVTRKGKNWYALSGNIIITVNAHSYTIITAHKEK